MEVRRETYLQKLTNSLVGVVIGIVLFFGSFILLFVNEGRENLGKVAAKAKDVVVSDAVKDESKLICMTGTLEAGEYATDPFLVDSNFLTIERIVEIYVYEETKLEDRKDNLGGSTDITTTYKYEKVWTRYPEKPSTFGGDENEKPTIPDVAGYTARIEGMPFHYYYKATDLYIGSISVNEGVAITGDKALALTAENTKLTGIDNGKLEDDYILDGVNPSPSLSNPALGDIRISYRVVPSQKGIIFGVFSENDRISGFTTKKDKTLFRFFAGVDTKAEAKTILIKEHRAITWLLRIIGFLMMFLGLMGLTGPITKFLSVVPFFSKVTGWIFAVAAFLVSLVLTTFIVLVSVIFHNIWLTIVFVLIVAGVITFFVMKKRKEGPTKQEDSTS